MQSRFADVVTRVRYAETDRMGVAHHAAYLVWFEMGRTEFCRLAGFPYSEMERDYGVFMTVVEARCRYVSGVTYDDAIRVRTALRRLTSRLAHFEYDIRDPATGRRVATGETLHLPVGSNGRRVTLPEKFFTKLDGYRSGLPETVAEVP